MKFLVIADSHINPAYPDVESWRKLGEYCVKTKPDCIIHLGDVADLNSLAWLKNARGIFTTEEELSCVSEHLEAFEDVIFNYNKERRQMKKAMYRPVKVLCLGNHDVRNGFTGIQELFEDFDWAVQPYMTPITINDISFCHCMSKGLSDSTCVTAEELLENWHGNIVVGHGHKQDYAESFSLAAGDRIRALKCPVFNSQDVGEWATQTRYKWAKGFTEITTDCNGLFEFTWKDITCLRRNY